jgi:small subunit ribosomal protein S3Ae
MAIGKNKKLGKKRKAGSRKKEDPFAKKEWFTIRAPSVFQTRNVGWTIASKTQGNKLSRDSLLGRVFTVSLGDLKPNSEEDAYRKFKLRCEEVQGSNVLTTFYGMDFSTDKLRSLVKKWHTLIEASADVVTTDGYKLRLFCIGFTRRRLNQNRKTSYAQSAQVRIIRKFMVDIMKREASTCSLTELVTKFIPEAIGRDIEKATKGVYPLTNVFIRKVKMIKPPATPSSKVLEMHGGAAAVAETGAAVEEAQE